MSTYFVSRRVNGPDHTLNRRLKGYCRGPVPWVPRATDYDPTNLDMTRFPLATNGWETLYLVPDTIIPLMVEGEGPT
jgi:hypothetical protein